jgi:hypothetical protein
MSDAEDVIAALIERAYDALAFEPGSEPDWGAFDSCFVEQAVLALRVFPTDTAVSILDLRDYALSQMRHDLESDGYSETPGAQSIRVVGDVAVVQQHFTINFRSGPVPAVDVFSLARTAVGWRIVSVVSDVVRAQLS